MSELCCKSQIPASSTVGGLAETRTVLRSVTDGQMEVRTDKDKTIRPPHIVAGHKNELLSLFLFPSGCVYICIIAGTFIVLLFYCTPVSILLFSFLFFRRICFFSGLASTETKKTMCIYTPPINSFKI